MKTKSDLVRFRLTPELGKQIRAFADKHGVTISTILTLSAIHALRTGTLVTDPRPAGFSKPSR
jgi:predicted DNA-binding protein with PD1-like motif